MWPYRNWRPATKRDEGERGAGTPPIKIDGPRHPQTLALSILAVVAIVAVMRFAEVVVVPFVLGVLISYALDPLVALLVRARIPRPLGATLLLTLSCAGIVAGGYALRSDVESLVEQLPDIAHRVGQMLAPGRGSTVGKMQQAAREIEQAASAATQPAAPRTPSGARPVQVEEPPIKLRDYLIIGSVGVAGVAAQIVVVIFLALYLLASGDLFKRKLVRIAGPSLTLGATSSE